MDNPIVDTALAIAKVTGSALDPRWLTDSAYVAFAVAVPALVLLEYVNVAVVVSSPPSPVTLAVHGVNALPV